MIAVWFVSRSAAFQKPPWVVKRSIGPWSLRRGGNCNNAGGWQVRFVEPFYLLGAPSAADAINRPARAGFRWRRISEWAGLCRSAPWVTALGCLERHRRVSTSGREAFVVPTRTATPAAPRARDPCRRQLRRHGLRRRGRRCVIFRFPGGDRHPQFGSQCGHLDADGGRA